MVHWVHIVEGGGGVEGELGGWAIFEAVLGGMGNLGIVPVLIWSGGARYMMIVCGYWNSGKGRGIDGR
jgi:hypothetical protein